MKLENKKILKISIISIITVVIFLCIYIVITSFNTSDKQAKGLIALSEVGDIRSILVKYHLQYGEYPKTNNDVVLNNMFLCNYSFYNSSKDCNNNFLLFKKYSNNFTYEKNLDGLDYSVKFYTNYDNKELGCIHNKKEKKNGCMFRISTSKLSVEK